MSLTKVFYQNKIANFTRSYPLIPLSSPKLQPEQISNEYDETVVDNLICQSISGLCYHIPTAEAASSSEVILGIKTATCLRQNLDGSISVYSKTASKEMSQASKRNEPTYKNNKDEDEQEDTWRGVFPLVNSAKTIFSEDVEIKIKELPSWKPNIIVDTYRFEDDDE